MSLSSLRTGERIAAAAAVLLFIDLFLDWYGLNVGDALGTFASSLGVNTSVSAWQAFDFTDLLLFVLVVAILGLVVVPATGHSMSLPVSRGAIIAAIGALATLLILWRLVNEPGPDGLIDIKFGAYLGLLFAAAIGFGGWRAMQEEGTSLQDVKEQAERAVGRGGSGPPPPATPGV